MKKFEMRVLVAKDVIKWPKAGKFVAKRGVYVSLGDRRKPVPLDDVDAKAVLNLKERKSCTVCQRGALLLAAIDRFDACKLGLVGNTASSKFEAMAGLNATATHDGIGGLARWFVPDQFLAMEYAFEDWNNEWGRAYSDSTARMDAICRNLIAHNGVFVMSDIPRPRKNPYWTKKR